MPFQQFLEYLKSEKRYSKHTLTSYRTDLNQFTEYLKNTFELTELSEVKSTYVRSWVVDMMDSGKSPRTVNRKITTLKSLYKFMLREGMVSENPMAKVQSPKVEKKLPEYIPGSDMEKLVDYPVFEDDYEGIRDKLILEMFYSTGMRLSELVSLKEIDVDTTQGNIKVLGKRNKERIIPMQGKLIDLIEKYRNAKTGITSKSDSFFLTLKGEKLYEKLVYRTVNKYLSKVTTINKKSPHVLRHTFATHMLNNGADLNAIKELLGHANLSATQVYTHNSIEKLKRIYKQAHPKA